MSEPGRFERIIKEASERVASWPQWKRDEMELEIRLQRRRRGNFSFSYKLELEAREQTEQSG